MAKSEIKTERIGAFSVMLDKTSGTMLMTPGESIKKSKPIIKDTTEVGKIAAWGENNLFPNEVVDDLKKSDLLPVVLDKKIQMLYSGGIGYGVLEGDGSNKQIVPLEIDYIEEFLHNSNINMYAHDSLNDIYTFSNLFARMRMNLKGDRIIRLEVSDAVHSRLGLQNNRGDIDYAYLNANWADGRNDKSSDTLKIKALDPFFRVADQIRENNVGDYIMPIRSQRNGNIYYDLAPWNGLRSIGWLDVAYFVPQFKKYLMQNQMTVKLLVKVDPEYWSMLYSGKWEGFSAEKKKEKQKELMDMIIDASKGSENAGGTIHLPKEWDVPSKSYKELITIEPLKQNLNGGEYNEDSQEADAHIYRALGVQGSLIGMTPGKNFTAGSGSDQRVGRNNFILDNKIYMDQSCMPLYTISAVNEWNYTAETKNKRLVWYYKNFLTATMDKGSPAQEIKEEGNGNS